ncbi:MAG: hypothetical protein Q4F47_08165, partial [Bacteroidaceae bacterium]|nr:hypothetical protein [Bacteroidaceae bacterium]
CIGIHHLTTIEYPIISHIKLQQLTWFIKLKFLLNHIAKLQRSRNNKPCMGKLLRLVVHFIVSTLYFVVCLSAIPMLP